jgi:hypothetical protein
MPRARASLRKNRSDLFHPAEKFALVVSIPHIPFRQLARCTHLKGFQSCAWRTARLGQRTIGQRGSKASSSRKVARHAQIGVALIGVAVEITINVAGRKDAEPVIKEIVSDRLATYVELAETAH